jgi:hypothetical protein
MVLSRALSSEFDASLALDGTQVMSGKVADHGQFLGIRVLESARLVRIKLSRFIQKVLRFHQIALYVRASLLPKAATNHMVRRVVNASPVTGSAARTISSAPGHFARR